MLARRAPGLGCRAWRFPPCRLMNEDAKQQSVVSSPESRKASPDGPKLHREYTPPVGVTHSHVMGYASLGDGIFMSHMTRVPVTEEEDALPNFSPILVVNIGWIGATQALVKPASMFYGRRAIDCINFLPHSYSYWFPSRITSEMQRLVDTMMVARKQYQDWEMREDPDDRLRAASPEMYEIPLVDDVNVVFHVHGGGGIAHYAALHRLLHEQGLIRLDEDDPNNALSETQGHSKFRILGTIMDFSLGELTQSLAHKGAMIAWSQTGDERGLHDPAPYFLDPATKLASYLMRKFVLSHSQWQAAFRSAERYLLETEMPFPQLYIANDNYEASKRFVSHLAEVHYAAGEDVFLECLEDVSVEYGGDLSVYGEDRLVAIIQAFIDERLHPQIDKTRFPFVYKQKLGVNQVSPAERALRYEQFLKNQVLPVMEGRVDKTGRVLPPSKDKKLSP